MPRILLSFALAVPLVLAAVPAPAQTAAPTARQMIDALRGAPRSMRNLGVEAEPETPPGPDGIDPSNIPMPPLAHPGATAAPVASAAAATAAPSAPASRPAGAGMIDLALQFEFDSDRLSPQDRATLNELAIAMRSPELAGRRFLIEGHTDNQGSPAYNLRLSRQRAQAVRALLVVQRVAPDRLFAEGKGAAEPIDPARPDAPENRRVRIISQVQ
jgi:outer membrane protein OmpA-like peptidoglycan-associated protein